MSKGSKVVPVRIEADLLAAICQQIDMTNEVRREEPYTLSEFIRSALREKLDKMRRGRGPRRRRSSE